MLMLLGTLQIFIGLFFIYTLVDNTKQFGLDRVVAGVTVFMAVISIVSGVTDFILR